ncbi:MAG: hypothetical protein ACP5VQ_09025, partial [Phycisphaerae bacterium]
MSYQKRICVMAALCMAMLAAGGCAGIQTTRLATPPDFTGIAHTAGLADVAATRGVRDSQVLLAQTTMAATNDAHVAALRP